MLKSSTENQKAFSAELDGALNGACDPFRLGTHSRRTPAPDSLNRAESGRRQHALLGRSQSLTMTANLGVIFPPAGAAADPSRTVMAPTHSATLHVCRLASGGSVLHETSGTEWQQPHLYILQTIVRS